MGGLIALPAVFIFYEADRTFFNWALIVIFVGTATHAKEIIDLFKI